MPNRMLRDWTCSELVDELTPQAEVFFVRLIMKADDFGCYYANPKILKSNLFPLRDITSDEICSLLDEVAAAGLVFHYKNGGKFFLMIKEFKQRLRKKRHTFPLPDDDESTLVSHMTAEEKRIEGKRIELEEKGREKPTFKKTIAERKTIFAKSLSNYLDKYPREMLKEFYLFWTEHGERDRKMKFEKRDSFDIGRRLGTWKRNDQKWKTHEPKKNRTEQDRIDSEERTARLAQELLSEMQPD